MGGHNKLTNMITEAKICREYKNGESALTIEKKHGICYRQVYRILKRNGQLSRSHSEKTINAILMGRSSNSDLQRSVTRSRWLGNKNPRWSGGQYEDKQGYRWIHDDKGRWRKEHRVIVERIIGRDLKREETIHHINEDKLDNRPCNLFYFENDSLHKRHHGLKNKPILRSNLRTITIS